MIRPARETTEARERRVQLPVARLLLAFVLVLFLWEAWDVTPQLDDAYISYRYARNLVEGHGLVYNPGDYVEGFTNLLWTLLVAAGMALGLGAKTTGHALGVASGALALAATFAYARVGATGERAWLAAVPPALVLSSASFARWSTSGMETPLFLATATGALALGAAGRMGGATTALVLATLTRPDGALLAVVLFGFHLHSRRRDWRRAWRAPAAYALCIALVTGFRLHYYGDLLPNTFYAKVGDVPIEMGLLRARQFLASGAAFLLPPAAVAAIAVPRLRPGAVWAALVFAYVIAVGGDAFGLSRFLLPILPCLSVLALGGAVRAWRAHRGAGLVLAAFLPLAMGWQVFGGLRPPDLSAGIGPALQSTHRSEAIRTAHQLDRYYEGLGRKQARLLRRHDPPVRLVAAGGIGVVGFHSRLPVLDILGLVDARVARSRRGARGEGSPLPGHHRSDADYVLAQRPDYILIPPRGEGLRTPANLDLWNHPELERHYEWDPEMRGYRLVPDAGEPVRAPDHPTGSRQRGAPRRP